jgi:hypothetical protein
VSTATKVKAVAVDKDMKLDIRVDGKHADGAPVTFTIKRTGGDEVDTVDGKIEKGRAKATWTASGPTADGDERVWRCFYEASVDDVTATSDEFDVYLPTLEVASKDEDGGDLPDMAFKVYIGKKVWRGNTGSTSSYTVQNLPPAPSEDIEVKWSAPARLVEWSEDTAGKKTAKLKKSFKAQLLFPKAGTHKQYVNLDKDKAHPEQGSKLTLRIGVHPDDGPSRAGDVFYVKVVYPSDDELSKRKTPGRALAGAKEQDWSSPDKGATYTLKADGGEAKLELELGLAGGDKVTVHVGGTDACEDEQVEVTNWRKLYYVLLQNKSSVLPSFQRTADKLAECFVEYEQQDKVEFTKADTPDTMAGSWVDAAEFGGAAGTDQLVIGSHNSKWFREKFAKLTIPKETLRRCIDLVICDRQYDGNDYKNRVYKDSKVTKLTAAQQKTQRLAGHVFPQNIQDGKHPLVRGTWRSLAPAGKTGHGAHGQLTEAMVSVDRSQDPRALFIDLSAAAKGDPASLVGDGSDDDHHPIEVSFTYVYVKGPYLGESDGQHQLIVLTPGADCFNDTILHELGHSMAQAVSKTNSPPKDLKLSDHDDAYDYHGHIGPHCAYNLNTNATHVYDDTNTVVALPGDAKDEPDYGRLCKADGKSAYGDCVMYGSGPSDDPSPFIGFCEKCQPFVKAVALKSVT